MHSETQVEYGCNKLDEFVRFLLSARSFNLPLYRLKAFTEANPGHPDDICFSEREYNVILSLQEGTVSSDRVNYLRARPTIAQDLPKPPQAHCVVAVAQECRPRALLSSLPQSPPNYTHAPSTPKEPEKKKREYKDFGHEEEGPTHANVSTIQLRAEDLYDREKVDLETILEDAFKLLQCDENGLPTEEATCCIEIFGPNKLESEEQNPFLQFLSFMWNPLSWVMEGAALVAIALSNGEDLVGIVLRLFINSGIGFYEERNAGNAVKALMESLAPKAKIKRDGSWSEIESSGLVPGDMVSFKMAALTGESLPQAKKLGHQCFSGSICKQGEAEGVVISTGANTFFGRAASLVGQDDDTTGHLQKILAQIGSFCLVSIGIFVILEIVVLYPRFHYTYLARRRDANCGFQSYRDDPAEFCIVATTLLFTLFYGSSFDCTFSFKLEYVGYDDIGGCRKQMAQIRELVKLPYRHHESLAKFQFDYMDLFLIHDPLSGSEKRLETYKALQECKAAGKIRTIVELKYGMLDMSYLLLIKSSKKDRAQDLSDVVRRVEGGEVVVVKKKKSRGGLDGLGWGTLGRGRKDSKEKEKEKAREISEVRPRPPRSKTPEPFKSVPETQSRARFNSLDSGMLLTSAQPTSFNAADHNSRNTSTPLLNAMDPIEPTYSRSATPTFGGLLAPPSQLWHDGSLPRRSWAQLRNGTGSGEQVSQKETDKGKDKVKTKSKDKDESKKKTKKEKEKGEKKEDKTQDQTPTHSQFSASNPLVSSLLLERVKLLWHGQRRMGQVVSSARG
ncbi:hypothetical protein BT96DRAFT_949203 [Gymnopus androsaceus JB14]|uniref:Cation-transporting P-type ATPase N-terminal domain-containing protein n=1 Tax=Gymnopus androsaceus JB14 TaxID=1447944 RepID=A0A6A4GLX5_9AGAR|nr:hypothetical protein BT96DRAFT_949203 [Gymnopus androsaceus JB14]